MSYIAAERYQVYLLRGLWTKIYEHVSLIGWDDLNDYVANPKNAHSHMRYQMKAKDHSYTRMYFYL
jgi:hypothetical protein